MNYILYILMPILALVLTILDTSFFSFWEVWNTTIISTFCMLMVVVMFGHRRASLVFGAFCTLFLAVFSSVPVYLLMITFFIIPLLVFYIRDKVFFEANYIPALIVFLLSGFIFRLILLPLNPEFNKDVLLSIVSFPIVNAIFSLLIFAVYKRINSAYSKN